MFSSGVFNIDYEIRILDFNDYAIYFHLCLYVCNTCTMVALNAFCGRVIIHVYYNTSPKRRNIMKMLPYPLCEFEGKEKNIDMYCWGSS